MDGDLRHKVESCATFLATLGGNNYHTVCGTGAIYCGCGSVLEHLYGFNIIDVEVDVVRCGHSVNHIQRVVVCEVADTADLDLWKRAYLASGSDAYAGCRTQKHSTDVLVRWL